MKTEEVGEGTWRKISPCWADRLSLCTKQVYLPDQWRPILSCPANPVFPEVFFFFFWKKIIIDHYIFATRLSWVEVTIFFKYKQKIDVNLTVPGNPNALRIRAYVGDIQPSTKLDFSEVKMRLAVIQVQENEYEERTLFFHQRLEAGLN